MCSKYRKRLQWKGLRLDNDTTLLRKYHQGRAKLKFANHCVKTVCHVYMLCMNRINEDLTMKSFELIGQYSQDPLQIRDILIDY